MVFYVTAWFVSQWAMVSVPYSQNTSKRNPWERNHLGSTSLGGTFPFSSLRSVRGNKDKPLPVWVNLHIPPRKKTNVLFFKPQSRHQESIVICAMEHIEIEVKRLTPVPTLSLHSFGKITCLNLDFLIGKMKMTVVACRMITLPYEKVAMEIKLMCIKI